MAYRKRCLLIAAVVALGSLAFQLVVQAAENGGPGSGGVCPPGMVPTFDELPGGELSMVGCVQNDAGVPLGSPHGSEDDEPDDGGHICPPGMAPMHDECIQDDIGIWWPKDPDDPDLDEPPGDGRDDDDPLISRPPTEYRAGVCSRPLEGKEKSYIGIIRHDDVVTYSVDAGVRSDERTSGFYPIDPKAAIDSALLYVSTKLANAVKDWIPVIVYYVDGEVRDSAISAIGCLPLIVESSRYDRTREAVDMERWDKYHLILQNCIHWADSIMLKFESESESM